MFRGFLPQSTAATRQLGPFVDATDGYTLETGLTLTKDSNVILVKNGTVSAWYDTGGNLASSGSGLYTLPFAADDLATLGAVEVYALTATGARPLEVHVWEVIPAAVYSALISGSALVSNITSILEDTGTTLPAAIDLITERARTNAEPDEVLVMADRRDGTYGANRPVRVRPGTVDPQRTIGLDVSKLFKDPARSVANIGTPVVNAGTLTCDAVAPRGRQAVVSLGGTAEAANTYTIDVDVTMDNGSQAKLRFEVEVFDE